MTDDELAATDDERAGEKVDRRARVAGDGGRGMTDITQQTARQLVDTIIIAFADKRTREATDAIDVLALRDGELEELRRDAAGLRAWNERLRARVAELEAQVAAAQHLTDAAIDFGVNEGSHDSTAWLLDEAVKYHEAQREKWDAEQVTP